MYSHSSLSYYGRGNKFQKPYAQRVHNSVARRSGIYIEPSPFDRHVSKKPRIRPPAFYACSLFTLFRSETFVEFLPSKGGPIRLRSD